MKKQAHDLKFEDIPDLEIQKMKGMAIRKLVDTPINSNVEAIIKVFMGYLKRNGYRIVKVENE